MSEGLYFTFKPRPDQPDRYDEQTSFMESNHTGVTFVVGGNGCLGGEEQLWCYERMRHVPVSSGESVLVKAPSGRLVWATPRAVGTEALFRFSLSNGESFVATMHHRIVAPDGKWYQMHEVVRESGTDGAVDCCRRCGALLSEAWNSPECHSNVPSFHSGSYPTVTGCKYLRTDTYYDFEVPEERAYWHKGVIHHNSGTTTCALMKAVDFMLRKQPPPRQDTPFWVISEGYQMAMDVCWNEKLNGRGMIPDHDVDWERIAWYKPRLNWPFAVPLKPWPGRPGKNWRIEFKSYDQGRTKMQASSIGGFCFVEQCPFELITETLRGCRDLNFPGAKLAEFTPIDPAMSAPLEKMLQEGTLPKDWAVYRMNTECAMEAGHVSREWFTEFFGMVSPEMRETRMVGAFASYEGLIYPRFNPRVHVIDDVQSMLLPSMIYKRAIDWGSGPEHAFVCLFGAKDAIGDWYIFDEYYSTDQNMTVIDHANAIKEIYPWRDGDSFHRNTYGDPSRPDLFRLFAREGISVSSANNSVYEGIETVRQRLARKKLTGEPSLFIDRRCANLIRELQIYRWERRRQTGVNPKDARPVPLKKDDHACVVEGTLVAMESGSKPIEQVQVGDVVQTHLGTAKVLGVACTGERECASVLFDDGTRVECSLDHRFHCNGGESWVLGGKTTATLFRLPEEESGRRLVGLVSRGVSLSSGAGISTASDRRLRPDGCVIGGRGGNSGTWLEKSLLPQESTGMSCCVSGLGMETPVTSDRKTSSRSWNPTKRSGSGSRSSGDGLRDGEYARSAETVSFVVRDLTHGPPVTGSARSNAVLDINAITTQWTRSVKCAGRHSSDPDMLRRKPVRGDADAVFVTRTERIGIRRVWTLATEHGTYVAGGIIHRNCDALRYLLHSDAVSSGKPDLTSRKARSRHHARFVRD